MGHRKQRKVREWQYELAINQYEREKGRCLHYHVETFGPSLTVPAFLCYASTALQMSSEHCHVTQLNMRLSRISISWSSKHKPLNECYSLPDLFKINAKF